MTFLSKVTVKNVLWLMRLKLSTQSLKTDPAGNVFCGLLQRKAMKQCKIPVAAMIHSIWLKQCGTCCATVCRQLLWYGNTNILQSIFLKQFSRMFWASKWVRIWSPLRLFEISVEVVFCGLLFHCLLLSKVKLFSFSSELNISINVTFFPFCYFTGKYLFFPVLK